MRKISVILTILLFNSLCSNCQLLSHPFLNVENVERALSNPDQLREILRDHGFVFQITGKSPRQAIINPLVSNAEENQTEYWRPGKNNKTSSTETESDILRSVSLIDWEPDHGPYSGVTKTIRLVVNADKDYAGRVENFFKTIKDRYPTRIEKYIGDSDVQRAYSSPLNVFVNDTSKIQVEMDQSQVNGRNGKVSDFYIVSFNLVR